MVDGAEVGISGVTVNLYRDNRQQRLRHRMARPSRTTTTNATGHYLFTGLIADTYIVEIVATGRLCSAAPATSAATSRRPTPTPDTTDNDDNGTAGAGVIRSAPVTLTVRRRADRRAATPGLPDDARDNNANYTVDFGLFRPLSLATWSGSTPITTAVVNGGETASAA